jgi:PIN domain nuclease of toxin-antitoxin system
MRLLLDTHLLIWVGGAETKLPAAARRLLGNPANELVFSAASIWEVALKGQRSSFGVDAGELRRALLDNNYVELPVTGDHAAATSALPAIHRDPFDRLLLAQAVVEGMTLVTSDATLASYPGPVRKV